MNNIEAARVMSVLDELLHSLRSVSLVTANALESAEDLEEVGEMASHGAASVRATSISTAQLRLWRRDACTLPLRWLGPPDRAAPKDAAPTTPARAQAKMPAKRFEDEHTFVGHGCCLHWVATRQQRRSNPSRNRPAPRPAPQLYG